MVRATIGGTVERMCPGEVPGPKDHFYQVRIDSPGVLRPGSVWFALLLDDGVLSASADGIVGDIDQDGTAEQLRVCTSNEGLHLTKWRFLDWTRPAVGELLGTVSSPPTHELAQLDRCRPAQRHGAGDAQTVRRPLFGLYDP